jgi:hypothetical protein
VKREKNDCLVSVAEETYTARRLAIEDWNAEAIPQCQELLRAGDKSRKILDDVKASDEKRSFAGERALRKYWEAKVCARRIQVGR